MTARSLPIYPTILKGKLHHSLPQSIISDRSRFEPWFYSNYIQLYCQKGDRGSFHVNFYEYFVWVHPIPPIAVEQLSRKTISMLGVSVIDFIVAAIDNGQYFYGYVDEYYVPLLLYQLRHFVHDLMIYGYDLEARQFDVVGMTKDNQLGTAKIGFDEFLQAFDDSHVTADFQRDIFLLSERKGEHSNYEFDPILVRELLEDYLLSRNTSERLRMYTNPIPFIFGMDVYDRYIADMEIAKESGELVSYLPIHLIFEHKACMVARLEYMVNNGFADGGKLSPWIERYRKEVYHQTHVLRSMILKRWQIRKNDPTVDQLIEKIKLIQAAERETLTGVLAVLTSV